MAGPLTGAPLTQGPAPWATLVTGLEAADHGVWRGQEEWPGGLRPAGRASWRVAPLWARLQAAGVSTGGVAWPAIEPGEAWEGLHIDERYAEASGRFADDWALPRGCMPARFRADLRGRRVHPTDITTGMLAPLVPGLDSIDQSRDDGLPIIAIGLARAATIQAAAAWLLAGPGGAPAPDAVFVHQPWLGRIRAFMGARREPSFAGVVDGAWRFLDGLVGRLAELAGPDALVVVASPHAAGAAGVLVAAGPGVAAQSEPLATRLIDLAPTLLARFGLEDRSLPGRRIAALWRGEDPLLPAPAPPPQAPSRPEPALVWALRRHGYRPPPRPGRPWKAQGLAELALMSLEQDPARALDLADAALAEHAGNLLALRVKARAHVGLEDAAPLPALADALDKAAPGRGWGALARGAAHVIRGERRQAEPWLRKAETDPEAGTLLTVAAVWLAAGRPAHAERVFKAVLVLEPHNVSAEIGLAMAAASRREFLVAEAALTRALAQDPARPAVYLQLAQIYARSGRKAEALRAAQAAARYGAPPAMAAAARAGKL
jgi:hypothetical protein